MELALKKDGLDFLVQNTGVPALAPAHLGEEVMFQRVVDRDDGKKTSPAQMCHQC